MPLMQHAGPLVRSDQKAPFHRPVSHYSRGAEQKRRRLAEEELRESSERAFQAYGAPLENVTSFKDLGRVMTVGDDYWPEVVGNLQ